jgi:GcrA cell cycle regulator
MHGHGPTWTEDAVARLKVLWADGLSASRIARELGAMSRNAVLGKVHRLGLAPRMARQRSDIPRRRKAWPPGPALGFFPPTAPRNNAALAYALPAEVLAADAPAPQPEPIDDIPVGQRCALLDLTATTCRWPVGDPGHPDFFFCGGKSLHGLPYCGDHAARSRASPKKPAAGG